MNKIFMWAMVVMVAGLMGCYTSSGNEGSVQTYPPMAVEAKWIRNGEPVEFEGELWYPSDGIESLLDSEVYLLGEYRGIQIFVDKLDVRPYNRLYTKFSKNKFRYYKKKSDQ